MFHDAAETKTGRMALCPQRQRGPDRLSAHPRRLPPTPMQVPKPRVAFFSGEEDPDFVAGKESASYLDSCVAVARVGKKERAG